jgi:hypothetical protein
MNNKGSVAVVVISLIGIIVLAFVVYIAYRIETGSFYIGDLSQSSPLNQTSPSDLCQRFMYSIASDFNQPDLCLKISPSLIGETGSGESSIGNGMDITYERSECYWNIALATKNENLCSNVKPVSTFFLDGSNFDESSCQNGVESTRTPSPQTYPIESANDNGDTDLNNLMAQLGYTPEDMQLRPDNTEIWPTISDLNGWNDYIQLLAWSTWPRVGPSSSWPSYNTDLTDFLNRVENLQCQASSS